MVLRDVLGTNATDIWNKDLCSYGGRISFKKSLKTAIPNARVTFYAGRSSNNGFEFRANFDDGRGIHWTFMSPTNNRHGVDFSLSRQVPMSCGLLFHMRIYLSFVLYWHVPHPRARICTARDVQTGHVAYQYLNRTLVLFETICNLNGGILCSVRITNMSWTNPVLLSGHSMVCPDRVRA